uniref:Histidinol dehydrogenase n=1 Tax=Candidatus Kentrum eta TaxID=2126337 RepID=A0A450USR0_9GAMM|nr:MAG: histidinol dehydrogenase [Candidatus Kentron sp. H]VFJ95568.1 MAG: histidinol dehydrogenase [Candidatus Kentron sp. H]VFK01784.1 MAG: histidinol dehydrogenase [Candidatus Kentron sp. H]
MKINVYELAKLSLRERSELLTRAEVDITGLLDTVRPIIASVREHGDDALSDYAKKFDQALVTPTTLAAKKNDFQRARDRLEPKLKDAIEISARNIRNFHKKQMPEEMWLMEVAPGIIAGEKVTPISSVGLYVPRGKGSFPSVMLMLCIPAVIAKVPKVIVCTPPTPEGTIDDASLYAAEVCGVTDLYKVGGSQAIAAMAYGTQVIPKVDKVIGPGNPYVSAAKRLLYGTIDVGIPAGPSEAIILCDETTAPDIAAMDLLIEAEHGPDSSALLVTHSAKLADEVRARLPSLINELPSERKNFCMSVMSTYGGIVITRNLDESVDFVNAFAPEHMEVLVEEPMAVLPKIKNAGEILLGKYTPITFGNFSLGVNAILPTGGFAKTFSCVTVHDFLKRSSVGYVTQDGYRDLKDPAYQLATYEGFPSHARAVRARA